ncbi:hypothetical protein EVAR_90730_1 [Eumeta japonica]|uniref:Uncharacterized protein n=1 Tax=Eumeta variegata TaxID=151549 RepID=A0A4C2A4B2_EUMVA|nr:hypothetical protein EVAR_90730_1 [Eumeta japonica]
MVLGNSEGKYLERTHISALVGRRTISRAARKLGQASYCGRLSRRLLSTYPRHMRLPTGFHLRLRIDAPTRRFAPPPPTGWRPLAGIKSAPAYTRRTNTDQLVSLRRLIGES